jgi:hypothetical protein
VACSASTARASDARASVCGLAAVVSKPCIRLTWREVNENGYCSFNACSSGFLTGLYIKPAPISVDRARLHAWPRLFLQPEPSAQVTTWGRRSKQRTWRNRWICFRDGAPQPALLLPGKRQHPESCLSRQRRP